MRHSEQVLKLLATQIEDAGEVDDIRKTATEVTTKWVDPVSGGKDAINGLIYGLIQSGKTGVLTVTAAMGADEGYRTILVLTSDNDPLYDQTLGRVEEALPGVDIIGKREFKDADSFLRRLRGGVCAIVTTKNARILGQLNENLKKGRVRGLSCLLIDDEADQASLNTRESRADGSRSAINEAIVTLRSFFEKNTYLQVTATPQALFLRPPGHDFRPTFTVLSHPGADYVGGEDFFGDGSKLVREFDINDISTLAPGAQPAPSLRIPLSLERALDAFMVGATFKRVSAADQNCAFLCHVSTRTSDHKHIVEVLRKYKEDLAAGLTRRTPSVLARLKAAFDDLASTHAGIRTFKFDSIVDDIKFLCPGTTVKLVNGETDEDVAVRKPYNLFVGGNKLGRGVTIKNLLVSYYGRNPKSPQADTVLQHARMYGYRRPDLGLLRLFLPGDLHVLFKAINRMEQGLRELIAARSTEEFRGVYLEGRLNPTRRNVLVPGAIGVYSGGATYNPAQVMRDATVTAVTAEIDKKLSSIANDQFVELPIEDLRALVVLTRPSSVGAERIWESRAIGEAIVQVSKLRKQKTGYVYVGRDRGLREGRRETQGILSGGESGRVPNDKVTLFLLRLKPAQGEVAGWWPQVRFPSGRYAVAFSV